MRGELSGSYCPAKDSTVAQTYAWDINLCGGRWVFGGFVEGYCDQRKLIVASGAFLQKLISNIAAMSERSEGAALKAAYVELRKNMPEDFSADSVYFMIDKNGDHRGVHLAYTGMATAMIIRKDGLARVLAPRVRSQFIDVDSGTMEFPRSEWEAIDEEDALLVACDLEVLDCLGRETISKLVDPTGDAVASVDRLLKATNQSRLRRDSNPAMAIVAKLY